MKYFVDRPLVFLLLTGCSSHQQMKKIGSDAELCALPMHCNPLQSHAIRDAYRPDNHSPQRDHDKLNGDYRILVYSPSGKCP